MPATQEDNQYANVELPEEILQELKIVQSKNVELRRLGIDDLVSLALTRYFERKNSKPISQVELAEH